MSHPCSCETCPNYIDSVRRTGYKKCKVTEYLMNSNVELIDHINKVGCISHPKALSYLNKKIIKKLNHEKELEIKYPSENADVRIRDIIMFIRLLRDVP